MDREMLWKAFAVSGDPVLYLLYRLAGSETENGQGALGDGAAPG